MFHYLFSAMLLNTQFFNAVVNNINIPKKIHSSSVQEENMLIDIELLHLILFLFSK